MPARRVFFIIICKLLHVLCHSQNYNRHLRQTSLAQRDVPKQVKVPAMTHDAAPKSPPHEKEISPGDIAEHIDSGAVQAANWQVANFGGVPEGDPGDFYGSNCKEVCAACTIAADPEYPSCRCRAGCERGPDSTECPKKLHGWLNRKPTTPESRWKASCNVGKTDCDKCLDEEVKAEIKKCRKEKIPAICFAKLTARYGSAEATLRYCSRGELKGCETFLYAPKDDGWMCFDDKAKCEEVHKERKFGKSAQEEQNEQLAEAMQIDNKVPPRPTRCVWCNIPIAK